MLPSSAAFLRRALVPFLASVALLAPAAASVATAAEACGSVITAPLARPAAADDPCPSADPVVCRIRIMPMDEKVEAQRTRMRYHGLLEDMHRTEAAMRESGASAARPSPAGNSPTPHPDPQGAQP
ncbi:hypothetical protein [Streptomyces sp. NPDC047976]|uniref:hypothetical protein n=1 Tax=Streptomyces sp. NPDC047976 TaxID=3155746 RepID=UPI00344595A0